MTAITNAGDHAVPPLRPPPETVDVEAEPSGEPSQDHPWRRAARAALPVWAIAYLGYVAVTLFAWFHPAKAPGLRHFFDMWLRYDAIAYSNIAESGYRAAPVDTYPAFFPLYPTLGLMANVVVPGRAHVAMVAVSGVALLAMLTVFHRLVEWEIDRETAGRAIWLVMLFPSAFFLGLGFNESLFIALMLTSVYAMRRGRWWLAGALGGLAVLTRSIGLLLCLAFAFEYLRQRNFSLRRIRVDALAVLLISAGLGVFMLYQWTALGDPLAFVHAMAPWGRELSWPWTGIVQTLQWMPARPALDNSNLHMLLDLSAVVFVGTLLVLAFAGPWKLRRDQLVWPLLAVAMLLFSISFPPSAERLQPLMGATRYVLEIVPAFVVLARIRSVERPYMFAALMLQGLLLAHFVRGGWVA